MDDLWIHELFFCSDFNSETKCLSHGLGFHSWCEKKQQQPPKKQKTQQQQKTLPLGLNMKVEHICVMQTHFFIINGHNQPEMKAQFLSLNTQLNVHSLSFGLESCMLIRGSYHWILVLLTVSFLGICFSTFAL